MSEAPCPVFTKHRRTEQCHRAGEATRHFTDLLRDKVTLPAVDRGSDPALDYRGTHTLATPFGSDRANLLGRSGANLLAKNGTEN